MTISSRRQRTPNELARRKSPTTRHISIKAYNIMNKQNTKKCKHDLHHQQNNVLAKPIMRHCQVFEQSLLLEMKFVQILDFVLHLLKEQISDMELPNFIFWVVWFWISL